MKGLYRGRQKVSKGGRSIRMAKHKQSQKEHILCGYEKLAFGSVADAVRLLFSDEPDLNALDTMDLFNIAEIKRPNVQKAAEWKLNFLTASKHCNV